MNKYKELFEGKFTTTRKNNFNIFERLYYQISASTYGDRIAFSNLDKLFSNKKKIKILDLGCGGGHMSLLKYGEVFGVDISEESLKNAKKIYKETKELDISKGIPYDDNTFDLVFFFEVYGHIDLHDKDLILKEIKRVLKNKGVVLISAETKGENIVTSYLSKNNLYKDLWIDYQGHIGLETPKNTIRRISNFFEIQKTYPISNHILAVEGYEIFDKKFKILKFIKINLLRRILNIIIAPLYLISLKIFDLDSANDLIILANKND